MANVYVSKHKRTLAMRSSLTIGWMGCCYEWRRHVQFTRQRFAESIHNLHSRNRSGCCIFVCVGGCSLYCTESPRDSTPTRPEKLAPSMLYAGLICEHYIVAPLKIVIFSCCVCTLNSRRNSKPQLQPQQQQLRPKKNTQQQQHQTHARIYAQHRVLSDLRTDDDDNDDALSSKQTSCGRRRIAAHHCTRTQST